MTVATYPIGIKVSGTMEVKPQWGFGAEIIAWASIMLGIEQAKRNEGTFLDDADLATDDDEE